MNIVLWVLQGLLAALFVVAGSMKVFMSEKICSRSPRTMRCPVKCVDGQQGDRLPKDAAHAAKLFEKACTARDMRGCMDLGLLLRQQACDGGEAYACAMLKR